MKLEEIVDDINYCVAAKVYFPKDEYYIIICDINYDHLVEIITDLKHFNSDAFVEDIYYYD